MVVYIILAAHSPIPSVAELIKNALEKIERGRRVREVVLQQYIQHVFRDFRQPFRLGAARVNLFYRWWYVHTREQKGASLIKGACFSLP